jgi:hypothetical protein
MRSSGALPLELSSSSTIPTNTYNAALLVAAFVLELRTLSPGLDAPAILHRCTSQGGDMACTSQRTPKPIYLTSFETYLRLG